MPRFVRSLLRRQSVACLACCGEMSFGFWFACAQAAALLGAARAAAATKAAAIRIIGMGPISSPRRDPLTSPRRPHTSGQRGVRPRIQPLRVEQKRERHAEFVEWYLALKEGKPCADCGQSYH